MRVDKITRVAQSAEGKARDVRHWKRRGAPLALTVLELALQQYERIGSHVGRRAMRRAGHLFRCCQAPADRTSR